MGISPLLPAEAMVAVERLNIRLRDVIGHAQVALKHPLLHFLVRTPREEIIHRCLHAAAALGRCDALYGVEANG